jgi:hypothetical protein
MASNSSRTTAAEIVDTSAAAAPGTSGDDGPPTETRGRNSVPSFSIWARRLSSTDFSSLNSGMP